MAVWFLKENYPEDLCVFKALYKHQLFLPTSSAAEGEGFWWGWEKTTLGLGIISKYVWAWETSFDSGGFFPCHFNSGDFLFLKSITQANKQKPPNQKWIE